MLNGLGLHADKLRGLSLFAGIDGFGFGLHDLIEPIAHVEWEPFAQAVLIQRMLNGDLPAAPIWDDVTSFDARQLAGLVDIIYGGSPCQDLSQAGGRKGLVGERSALFFEIVRLARECRPPLVLVENVWPMVKGSRRTMVHAFESLGYRVRDGHIRAAFLGAPYRRARWFMLAADVDGLRGWIQPRGGQGRVGPIRPSIQTLLRDGSMPTLTVKGKYNRKGASPTSGDGLVTRLRELLPTLRASDGFHAGMNQRDSDGRPALLPTLVARDYKGPPSPMYANSNLAKEAGGLLNPTWCQWYQGFPLGWTDVSDARLLRLLGTAWYPRRSERRSKGSRVSKEKEGGK